MRSCWLASDRCARIPDTFGIRCPDRRCRPTTSQIEDQPSRCRCTSRGCDRQAVSSQTVSVRNSVRRDPPATLRPCPGPERARRRRRLRGVGAGSANPAWCRHHRIHQLRHRGHTVRRSGPVRTRHPARRSPAAAPATSAHHQPPAPLRSRTSVVMATRPAAAQRLGGRTGGPRAGEATRRHGGQH